MVYSKGVNTIHGPSSYTAFRYIIKITISWENPWDDKNQSFFVLIHQIIV